MSAPLPLEEMCERRHDARAGEWVFFRELANGTGAFSGRRIDVAAFNCWPSKNFHRVAYEVKRSRSDFLRELDQPGKRTWAEQYFHETWFACAPDVCDPAEVPDGWGLLVATKDGKLRRLKVARSREADPLTAWMMAAILRRAYTQLQQERAKIFRFEGQEVPAEALQAIVDQRVAENTKWKVDDLDRYRRETERVTNEHRRKERELEAPLEALRRAVGDRWQPLTQQNVERWIAEVQAGVLTTDRQALESAHGALGRLLGKEVA